MYLICSKCEYIIDAKPYHKGQKCPQCGEGTMIEMTEEQEQYYGKTTEKWNVYVAILLYPGSLTAQEYAELCVKHLDWCRQNGIQQVVHAAYKMDQTTEEVNEITSRIVKSISNP